MKCHAICRHSAYCGTKAWSTSLQSQRRAERLLLDIWARFNGSNSNELLCENPRLRQYPKRYAKERLYLTGSSIEDPGISGMNPGWEVPGTFDAGFEFKGFDLKYSAVSN